MPKYKEASLPAMVSGAIFLILIGWIGIYIYFEYGGMPTVIFALIQFQIVSIMMSVIRVAEAIAFLGEALMVYKDLSLGRPNAGE